MQWRRATRPEDETLCLARLLDLDPLPILACQAEEEELRNRRMVKFLLLIDRSVGIPSGMVFLLGPKLPVRGFSWAPRSWMTRRSRHAGAPLLTMDQRPSFLTLRGLQVQYPAVQLHPRRGAAEPSCFWIPTARNLRRWLRVRYARDTPDQGNADWAAAWAAACAGAELPCIIRSRFDDHEEPEIALLVKRLTRSSSWDRTDVSWVKALCRVWIQVETDSTVVARHAANFRFHVGTMTWGETLDGSQRWVIDGELDEEHGSYQLDDAQLIDFRGPDLSTKPIKPKEARDTEQISLPLRNTIDEPDCDNRQLDKQVDRSVDKQACSGEQLPQLGQPISSLRSMCCYTLMRFLDPLPRGSKRIKYTCVSV
jgi:hypothetical protein